jgi:predicted GNAT family acetyltransferase
MDTGPRTSGHAACRVRQTNAVPASMRAGIREVCSVEVPAEHQGQGHATALLHKVCSEADKAGIVLVLWPQPWGDNIALSREQLVDWYARRFGFQAIQPEPLLMARMPGATPRLLRLNPTIEALHA